MAEIVVTDEAVEVVAKAVKPDLFAEDSLVPEVLRNSARWSLRHEVRAGLEAAAPLFQVRVDRQTLALLLADTVQTLDKDEEWFIADRVLALLSPEETK